MHKDENENCQPFKFDNEKKNLYNEDYKIKNDIINEENKNLIKNENNREENTSYKYESKTDIINNNNNNNFDDTVSINLSNDTMEDKIIKSYLSNQINNVNSNINKEKENESQNINIIRDSNSDMDDMPLLKAFKKGELKTDSKIISKKLNDKEEHKEGETIKNEDSLIEKENIMEIRKENHAGLELSSDDECLLNLIKSDNKLYKNSENLSDKSSCDSDEPILTRSRIENENNNNKKIIGNSSENKNVVKSSNINHSSKYNDKKLNNNVKKINPKKVSANKNSINKGNTTKKISLVSKNKSRKLKKKKNN